MIIITHFNFAGKRVPFSSPSVLIKDKSLIFIFNAKISGLCNPSQNIFSDDADIDCLQGARGSRGDDFSSLINSGSNMGSIARFPKLDECAHFHYEHVELGSLEVRIIN